MGNGARGTGPLGRRFWTLWSATSISSVGDGLALAALPLLAVTLTGNALAVAAVVTVQTLPWLVVAVPVGALADRMDRVTAMVAADVARAVVMAMVAALVLLGGMTMPALYALAFALGLFETLGVAAAQATIPSLAGPERLARANSYLVASENTGGHFAGPAVGGIVFAAGRMLPFAADAASFLGSAGLLSTLRPGSRDRRHPALTSAPAASPSTGAASGPAPPLARPRTSFGSDMAAGLTFFRSSRLLPMLAAMTAGLAFMQAMVMAPFVLFALRDLGLSQAGYGLFLGVTSLGNVAGSLAAPWARARLGTGWLLFSSGVLAALAYLAVATTSSVGWALVAFLVEAFAVACGSVASVTLRQRHIPPELLGRVSNVFRTAIWGAVPVGALVGGVLAQHLGLRAPFLVAGAAQVVLALAVGLPLERRTRRAEAPDCQAGRER
ncbi:MAG: MFS transporter [Acidimicrobiales bacterium]